MEGAFRVQRISNALRACQAVMERYWLVGFNVLGRHIVALRNGEEERAHALVTLLAGTRRSPLRGSARRCCARRPC